MLHTMFCENRPVGSGEENAPHEILLFQRRKSLKVCMVTAWSRSRDNHFSGLRLQYFFKKSIVFTFSHVKTYVSKTDLVVKVILGSSFDQIRIGWSPKCYIHVPSNVR